MSGGRVAEVKAANALSGSVAREVWSSPRFAVPPGLTRRSLRAAPSKAAAVHHVEECRRAGVPTHAAGAGQGVGGTGARL